jgi:hypothetical protein
MRLFIRFFAVISMVMLFHTDSSAQNSHEGNVQGSRGDSLVIKLATIGPGDDLTSWWGHTAIIVEDNKFNVSRFYNYGLFSFEQENFVTNFVMGRLIFWVGAWNTSDALALYVSLNREIRFQILDLSPEKRVEIATFLATNIRPENREYLYDHYRDNCSTRVRDIFDQLLGDQFYPQTQIASMMTFRDHTRRHTDHNFVIDWLLMFLMNNTIDQEIRRWDDMFLPEELERNIADFSYQDEFGQTRKLVKSNYTFFQAKDRDPLPEGAPAHWPVGLIIGMSSSILALLVGIGYSRQTKYMRQLFGVYHIVIGIIYGIPGLVLLFMSFFTDHIVTYHNENLLLANPFTFLVFPLGIGIILKNEFSLRWLPTLWYFLCGLNIILLLLKVLPVFDQYNWLSISIIVPLNLAMAFSWYQTTKLSH